jgi:CRISPR system Cascade subunit CasB
MSEQKTVAEPEPKVDSEAGFVQRVRDLDRGNRAALGRNAGNTIAEARGVNWFGRLLETEQRGRYEEVYFLVATLMPLNRHSAQGKDLGQTLATLAGKANREAVERRFNVLLDAQFDLVEDWKPGGGELAFRLRQLIRLAASKEVGIDWVQLVRDLKRWGDPEKRVQKRWASAFYAPPAPAPEPSKASNSSLTSSFAR